MKPSTLLPCLAGIHTERITSTENSIVLHLVAVASLAVCPLCGQRSQRIHSHYRRTLADLPWNRVAVQIHLRVRKFYCDHSECPRRIFTEPLLDLAARYARKTHRLQNALYLIGYALGGEAGARVAVGLGLSVSPDTLLLRVRQAGKSFSSPTSGRVVGIDDFALRRGQRYGTILVDLERRRLLDLLPDRSTGTVADWLKTHPEIEIVSRDRAEAYAEGATKGAPQAKQVADRWHLLKNVGDAVERALLRHHRFLKETTRQMKEHVASPPQDAPSSQPSPPPTRDEREKILRREKRLGVYEQVHALYRQGYHHSGIARQTGLSRRTIRKYLQATSCPYYPETRRRRRTVVTPFVSYLKYRWDAGCHNVAQLFREIQAQGYEGQYSILRDTLQAWRACLSFEERQSTTGKRGNPRSREGTPSPRSVRWWLLGHFSKTDDEKCSWQQSFVQTLCAACPEIQTLHILSEEFRQIVKERCASRLDLWVEKAQGCSVPELQGLAKSFRQDKAAVSMALSCEWSNGQVEGQVNRLKMLKRQMYGRAKFDLLRARVLPMVQSA